MPSLWCEVRVLLTYLSAGDAEELKNFHLSLKKALKHIQKLMLHSVQRGEESALHFPFHFLSPGKDQNCWEVLIML